MNARRDVFQAIADPTRREILNLLESNPMNLNALSDNFNVSRPAISKHVKILTECGLISIVKVGRERNCVATLDKLHEVNEWTAKFKAHWESHLDSLENYLNKIQKDKK